MEKEVEDSYKKCEELQSTLDTVRENAQREARQLDRENHALSQQVAALRQRSEQTENLRVQEVEGENSRLHARVKDLSAEVSQLDHDLRTLQKQHAKLEASNHSKSELEEYNARLQKQVCYIISCIYLNLKVYELGLSLLTSAIYDSKRPLNKSAVFHS